MGDDWRPIETAPRDGTVVELMHEDVGSYRMRWNPIGDNPLVSLEIGLWKAPDESFTWCEDSGHGPSHWRPAPPEDE
ncbi:hypothetical protein [Enterovirga rhinocerotis]|uniref:DUF551 domain-containing protein n=1 Tax=Enterovirga rhinocerotis TaxID=1339210 RepID=A0A4R7BXN5_9HYPH|nr:hypothetical protein [Enterovirga rhinocerotis]TDR90351.1 hypothetical protein EV668_3202 [Enterovirga rhinocerotis]